MEIYSSFLCGDGDALDEAGELKNSILPVHFKHVGCSRDYIIET